MALYNLYCADVPLRNCSLPLSSLKYFRVATLTLRLHVVVGHLITLFAIFKISYTCFIGTDTNLKSVRYSINHFVAIST